MNHNPVKKLAILSTLVLTLGLFAVTPATLAYGSGAQWQIGFSGTCNVASACSILGFPPGFTGGFWGWCEFGGSTGSSAVGTTGNSGDCQISTYLDAAGTHATNPFHVSQDVTSWMIATGSAFVSPGTPSFFVTGGSLELTGPGAPGPTGVTIPLAAVCNLSNIPTSLVGNPACDTGIPASPGHFSMHPVPGVELNIQVNKLS